MGISMSRSPPPAELEAPAAPSRGPWRHALVGRRCVGKAVAQQDGGVPPAAAVLPAAPADLLEAERQGQAAGAALKNAEARETRMAAPVSFSRVSVRPTAWLPERLVPTWLAGRTPPGCYRPTASARTNG